MYRMESMVPKVSIKKDHRIFLALGLGKFTYSLSYFCFMNKTTLTCASKTLGKYSKSPYRLWKYAMYILRMVVVVPNIHKKNAMLKNRWVLAFQFLITFVQQFITSFIV